MNQLRSIGVLLLLALSLTACQNAEVLLTSPPPASTPHKMGRIELEQGRPHYLVLHVQNMPAQTHTWKARVDVDIQAPDGSHQRASGGPKKFIKRHSQGDGSHYYSELLLLTMTPEQSGTYTFTIDDSLSQIPPGASVQLELRRGSTWETHHDLRFFLLGTRRRRILFAFSVFVILATIIYFTKAARTRGYTSGYMGGSSSSNYIGCGGSGCGGGCGSGCGGCGGCGGGS